ncbi:YbaY family lipoprotein [Marinobacter sp. SS21]|uniref:YbaY family lipoprotein n=1 Tax=Marinobacter sp. SS21 TaxID=2979460 RepID=UPI00232D481C|nr:YbaY family lipoprotein [Marinobacter sp. SS21]MDC0662302.1 YbaY family lipoprotein [Marinobacter sp. SS21]
MTMSVLGRHVLLLCLAWGLVGCAGAIKPVSAPTVAADPYRITGQVTYRERIALPPKSVVTVVLEDISLADRAAVTMAETVMVTDRNQVPFKFLLELDSAALQPRHRYAVRATIHDVRGQLLWTTDTVHAIDPAQSGADLGELVLVRVTSR